MRDKLDRYYTPSLVAAACTRVALAELGPPRVRDLPAMIEPSIGSGAWAKAFIGEMNTRHIETKIVAYDLDPDAAGLKRHGGTHADWLTAEVPAYARGGLVLGNPPYKGALDHIAKALEVSSAVGFLLRLSILESSKRKQLWIDYPPRKVWTLTSRPSFTGDGKGDSVGYVFVLWDQYWTEEPRLDWLDWRS